MYERLESNIKAEMHDYFHKKDPKVMIELLEHKDLVLIE